MARSLDVVLRCVSVLSWLGILALIVLTVVPAAERPTTYLAHGYEHIVAFAIVGFLVGLSFRLPPLALFLLAIAFAGGLELMQIPLPTRHARLEDFVSDTFGSWLGLAIGCATSAGLTRRTAWRVTRIGRNRPPRTRGGTGAQTSTARLDLGASDAEGVEGQGCAIAQHSCDQHKRRRTSEDTGR